MTLNGRKVLIISNLVTIAVTATAVLLGLHYNDQAAVMSMEQSMEPEQHQRLLQDDCCDCSTGEPIDPTPAPPTAFCFPSHATVQLATGAHVPLDSVEIGTVVHVGDNEYEPIYSFGHYDPKIVANDYIKLSTASAKSLILSPQHMVWTCNHATFVPAAHVKIGDELLYDGDGGGCTTVTSIESDLTFRGALAPFTPSGALVVNGVKVSSFVALDDSIPYPHAFAHAFEFPHRIMCHYLASCPQETYTDDGVSTWVAEPLVWSQWILAALQNHPVVSTMFFTLLTIAAGILKLVEFVGFQYPFMSLMMAAGAYYYGRLQPKKV